MISIITLLGWFDGKRIPVSWPLGFSLNSYISILSGFARSALILPTAEALGQLKWNLFQKEARNMLDFERLDMASRGPMGALILLARMRGL
jgi:hypothetical protein